ncbi:MAG: hypothetical protein ACYC91_13310 [Solirubrobacteraceae bacterium]
MSDHHDSHSVRRIILPSGRSIEVVRFHDSEARQEIALHVCPNCDSDLVQPTAWTESDALQGRWELTLECPNCWWAHAGIFSRIEVERLEDRLDEGLADMLGDLRRLTQANMVDEIDRFLAALDADLILPEDF